MTEPALSFAQQRLWLLDQIESTPWAYNVVVARRLRGPLDLEPLQRALDELLVRHAVLRTTYSVVDGEPVQRIGPPHPFPLSVVDLSDRPPTDAELKRRAGAEVRRTFDLEHGPMIRGLVIRLGADDHAIVLTMHHIVTDAWSEAVLLRELGALYDAFSRGEASPLDPLPIDYADVAVWQRERMTGEHLEAQLDYWRGRLDDLPPSLNIATDHPRPAHRSGRGGAVAIEVDPEVTGALRRVAQNARATMFMTLLAAFQTLLARYSGEDDIAVGTAIANRPRVETEGIVGFFANTLVLRTDVSGNPTFSELIGRVREVALGAYRHQDLPFERLVKELQPERTLRHTPLFQHMFVFQNTPAEELMLGGVRTEVLPLDHETAMFDLTLTLSESDDRIAGTLEYSSDLFERETAERIAAHFQRLLSGVAETPVRPIRELDLLGASERHRLLVEWNDTGAHFPDRCIHEIFEQQAAAHPDEVAISDNGRLLTYADLNAQADGIARRLRRLGVGPEAHVGICLPRSADAIAAMLGTLKANGAYVPLDPSYPRARLEYMIDDAQIQVIVTRTALRNCVDDSRAAVVCLDDDERFTEEPDVGEVASTATPANLAFILYTSGSTGAPKGVMIEHRSVVARLFGVDYIRFAEVRGLLHMAPLAFDASTFEIWGALLHGARCVVCADERFALDRLAEVLNAGVDTAWLTAAAFNAVVDVDWRMLSGLRQLIIGGEALSVEHVARARDRLPDLRLVNGYGPTETTTFAASHEIRSVEPGADRIPIGRPIANTQFYVLDERQCPVAIGVPGELYIGGAGVARGYVDRTQLTGDRFLPDPFDPAAGGRLYRTGDRVRYRVNGDVEFLGRLDHQVKIRGFRVEPGELEAVLGGLPTISGCAVVTRADARGTQQLVAYVVAREPDEFSAAVVRSQLRALLPEYLSPSVIVRLDALPLTPNGKVDRRALVELDAPGEPEVAYTAPVSETEKVLADLWGSILGVEHVGLDDDFFLAGGDSLLAAALIAQVKRRLGKTIPLPVFFRGPTIRAAAEALDSEIADESTVVALRAAGTRPPLFLVHNVSGQLFRYVPLVRLLDADQPVYGLHLTTALIASSRRVRIPALARRYVDDILRAQPDGPYLLGGFSFGGIMAVEIAHQLEERGREVALIALFDTEPRTSPPPSRVQREAAQLQSLVRGSHSVASYFERRANSLRIRARRAPWLVEHWLHRRAGRRLRKRWDNVEQVEALKVAPVPRSLYQALSAYVSPPTRCAVTYFRAGTSTTSDSAVHVREREDGTPGWYIVDGPGISHDSFMSEPHIRHLARALDDCLVRALNTSHE
jgi:amino acid adenylation domain-containing protein